MLQDEASDIYLEVDLVAVFRIPVEGFSYRVIQVCHSGGLGVTDKLEVGFMGYNFSALVDAGRPGIDADGILVLEL